MQDKIIPQKHFPAETLQRVKRTDRIVSLNSELFVHLLDKDVSDLPNRTPAALKCSSQAALQKGFESFLIHLAVVRRGDWC